MKKFMMLMVSILSVVALSGCGGGGSDYYEEPYNDGLTTLFLVDDEGYAYADIPYQCESMTYPSVTAYNGEFSFYPGEDCTFDLYGYYGTDPDDMTVPYNEYIYIVDDLDRGKNDIPYECALFNVGFVNYTYDDGIWDGSFDYDADDICVFYF
jgi:hypothetical protein